MPTAGHDSNHLFLTVVAWPRDWDRARVTQLLAKACEADAPTISMRLGQPPPMILPPMDAAAAVRGAEALCTAGGDGFAFTLDDLAALGPTFKIKDLRVEGNSLALDIWRGRPTSLAQEDIQILVRAQLSDASRGDRARDAASDARLRVFERTVFLRYGWAARERFNQGMDDWVASEKTVTTSDKLDIHATDGRVFQVDGDKFAYRVLGDLRGHSDKANMDSLCELLSMLAPAEIVDEFYCLWRPPPGLARLRIPDMKINQDDPAFAFYSRWTALTYRHVLGAPGPA